MLPFTENLFMPGSGQAWFLMVQQLCKVVNVSCIGRARGLGGSHPGYLGYPESSWASYSTALCFRV